MEKEQDSSMLTPEGVRANFERVLNEMVMRSNLRVEGLTQAQVVDAIRQMIECGDFVRLVRTDAATQAVIYHPYAELEKVKRERDDEVLEKVKWMEFGTPILDAAKEHTGDGCMGEEDQEIMERAAKLGLGNVQMAPYNPDIHGSIDASPGDQIFFWGKSPIPPVDGWQCECGATPDIADGSWRWSGTAWEHHHGHPIGHVPAKRIT